MGFRKSILLLSHFLLVGELAYAQTPTHNADASVVTYLNIAMTADFEIGEIDTAFFETGEIKKVRFYDSLDSLRKVVSFYLEGGVARITNTDTENELSGFSISLFASGKLRSLGLYFKGVGKYFKYYENGRLQEIGSLNGSAYAGYRATFCDNGFLYSETYYDNSEYESEGYHCNGQIRERGILSEGKKVGVWEDFDEEGNSIMNKD